MELRKTHFPYCLDRQKDGRYILLNRDYKPLGFNTRDILKYEEYPIGFKISMTPKRAAKLSFNGKTDTDRIYFYNDGTIPTRAARHMKAYLGRLALLMKWQTR